MGQLLTRPMWRDWIRRQLQIVPPIDVSAGPAGMQPDWNPQPTNAQINDCLQNALNRISVFTGCHIAQITYSVAAQSASLLGPLAIPMGTIPLTGTANVTVHDPIAFITDIQAIYWTPSGGTQQRLLPTSRDQLDRLQSDYMILGVGTPFQWYIEGYTLYITSAPSSAGSLLIISGTGFSGLQTEFDPVDQLPVDMQPTIGYETLGLLSLMQTMDAEARERAANFLPLAMEGKQDIKAWKEGGTGTVQPCFAFASYRQSYGTRRIRR